jgi:dethiobiotin synthetase
VQLDVIKQAFDDLTDQAEVVLVEGAGGWFAPLNSNNDIADLVKILQIPVILVVAIRLGCINHARLTFQAIENSTVKCTGWFAMCTDPDMEKQVENIETIINKISVPLLGILPYTETMDFDLLAANIIGENLTLPVK